MQRYSVVQIADQTQFNLNAGNIIRPLSLPNLSNLLRNDFNEESKTSQNDAKIH